MKLRESKKLFFDFRKQNRIDVCETHVIGEHPERAYSIDEVKSLVKEAGTLQDTTDSQHRGERFYWRTKDLAGNKVRLVVEFEKDEIGQLILVVSAGERR